MNAWPSISSVLGLSTSLVSNTVAIVLCPTSNLQESVQAGNECVGLRTIVLECLLTKCILIRIMNINSIIMNYSIREESIVHYSLVTCHKTEVSLVQ